MLARAHLVELTDLPATPRPLRDALIESLSRTLVWGGVIDALVPEVRAFLAAAGGGEVLELCAGAGGPAAHLCRALDRDGLSFLLTDLVPQVEAWRALRDHGEGIEFVAEPVDATAVPAELSDGRARVLLNAFHHFAPDAAARILADAVAARAPIFIAEPFERNPLRFFALAPAGVPAMLANPWFAREHRLAKALYTWATPIAFATGMWDGLVSTLRIYSEPELREMARRAGGGYRWRYATYRYLVGGRGYTFWGVPA